MEQTNTTFPAQDPEDSGLLEIDLSTLFKAVLTRIKLVIALCTVVIAIALVYCFTATPIFVANCRMLVESANLKLTNIQDVYESDFGSDAKSRDSFLATQMQLIKSDHILARVFDHFKLGEKPQFENSREPLKALADLIVLRQVPNTSLLDIGFKWDDARFSAEVTNYIANLYMQDSLQRASGFSQRGLEKLQEELLSMEKKRLAAIEVLNAYKTKHHILSVESSQNLGIARITELDKAMATAEEARATAAANVASIDQWRAAGLRLDSLPEAIANPTLTQFKMAKLQAQALLVQSLVDYGADHKAVRAQRQVIADMDKAIAEEVENSLVSARAKLEQAKTRIAILEKDIETARTALMQLDKIADEYKMLEDNLTAAEDSYRFVLKRVNELQISKSADSTAGGTFQILVPATPPSQAAYPEKAKIMVIAALLAGMFSVMLCIVLELLDKRIQKKTDVESITRVPVFGLIPRAEGTDAVDFIALSDSRGKVAESFRSLRTSLSLSESSRKARLLAITSSMANEGKSFVSLNIAIAQAQTGKRILLVDTDLYKHRLTSLLIAHDGGKYPKGLSNILAEDVALGDFGTLVSSPVENCPVYFLPAGPTPPNPAELLGSENMEQLCAALLEHFDMIIFDAPPVLSVSDARVLSGISGMRYLLVVRMLATEKRQLKVSMEALRTVDARVVGTILNCADVQGDSYYSYGYGYSYYYSYGYGDDKSEKSGKKKKNN